MKSASMVLTAGFLALLIQAGSICSSEKTPLDVYGDPLPAGATAQFGSLRWRMPDAIDAVAMSPDGKLVASVNMHGKVAEWEKETGRRLHEFSGSKTGEGCLAFSPDSNYLATGSRFDNRTGTTDGRVRVWELSTGKLKAAFANQENEITKVSFSPDGKTVVSSGFDLPVTVWEFPSGKKLRKFQSIEDEFGHFALSADGKQIAVTTDLYTVDVYDFAKGTKVRRLQTKEYHYNNFQFFPDNLSLLTLERNRLCIWEVATGKARLSTPLSNNLDRKPYISPDGKKIAMTTGVDKNLQWLDASTGKLLETWKGRAGNSGTGSFNALAFSADGKTVVSGDWGMIRLWDTATGKVVQEPSGPDQICYSLVFSADGKTLLAAGKDFFCFLDGQTLRERVRVPVKMFQHSYPDYRYSVALSPDGKLAAFLGEKDEIFLLDSRHPKAVRTLRRPGWLPASLAFSADGKLLYAVGHKSAGLRVWDVQTGQEGTPLDKNFLPRSNISLAPKVGKLAIVEKGGQCRIWDLSTGKAEPGPKNVPDCILLSPDGKLLAGDDGNHVIVWDLTQHAQLYRFDFDLDRTQVSSFSADGKYLVTGHDDGSFKTWNMADGKKVAEMRGHPSHITGLACSPDGGMASTCTSCTVLRWQQSAWQGK